MTRIDVQDAPAAVRLGVGDFVLVDYSGDLYPRNSRQLTSYRQWLPVITAPQVLPVWHFDLHSHSSLLEQLLWSGWQGVFTVSGVYVPGLFPLSRSVVKNLNRRCRGIVSVPVLAAPEELWAEDPLAQAQQIADRVVVPPLPRAEDWAVNVVPPAWATSSVRNYLTRKWRLNQLHALGEEQVRLRLAWLDLSGHKIPA